MARLLVYTLLMLAMNSLGAAATPVFPRALRPGDTIALVAPARSIGAERHARLVADLEKMGYRVKSAPNVEQVWGYLAGSDEVRAATFMEAWNDPEVTAVFCVTGGYGTTRLLDMLDYEAIARQPKILTGFSDITGIHLAVHAKTGLVTYHSPTAPAAYGNRPDERPIQAKYLWRAITGDGLDAAAPGYPIPDASDKLSTPTITMVPGVARGRLTGGNLSLVAAVQGTPYAMETEGRILFLEDVGEQPYRVDRMLSTLALAGALDNPAAVILGQFDDCNPKPGSVSFTLDEVLDQYFAHRPYPVVKQFPTGHVIDNATLPLGVMAELNASTGVLTLLENPVALGE